MSEQDTMVNRQFSRRTLLKGAGIGAASFTLAQIGFIRSAAAETESLQQLLNITATTERFGVTVLGAALESEAQGNFNKAWPDGVRAIVTAARAQEQFHLDAFESLGGEALTGTFTLPEALLTDYDTFFGAVVDLEAREISLQMVGMRIFSEMQRPDIAKISFQYAAEEAEHRVLANYALGTRPATDLAFERAIYNEPMEHVAFVKEQGLIGGSGKEYHYPGPGEIDPTNVTNRTPDGPAVSCAPMPNGMGNTGGGGTYKATDGFPNSLGALGLLGLGAATVGIINRRMAAQSRKDGA